MTDFKLHDEKTAPKAAQATLTGLKKRMGYIPNLMAKMAEAPALLDGYLAMGNFVKQTSFTVPERHVIWLAIIHEHRCDYCAKAHTKIAQDEGVPDDMIKAAVSGQSINNPKLEVLRLFVIDMVEMRGHLDESCVANFIDQGYTQQQVLEVILIIAHKVLSNYTNHVASEGDNQ